MGQLDDACVPGRAARSLLSPSWPLCSTTGSGRKLRSRASRQWRLGPTSSCAPAICVVSILQRWYLSRHPERGATLLANHTSHISLDNTTEPLTAPGISTWLSRLPGNQVLNVCVQEKEIALPRLAASHDGLRIAHLTDLHMSGRLTRAFFEQVVDEVNRTSVDIIAVTGDIVEGNRFLDWLPSTLGRLESRYGVYYVLGNHDRHADETQLRAALA